MVFAKSQKQILLALLVVLVFCIDLSFSSGFCTSPVHDDDSHGHHHNHQGCAVGHAHHHHHHHHDRDHDGQLIESMLPEELAEEEDMKLYGFSNYHHDHHSHGHDHDSKLTGLGLWSHALGCSLLVSLASLICLIILPVIFIQGKPSKAVVDSLALFGAGAMLGDAFLHQLPHAFGGEHSHSHDHDTDHSHHAHIGHGHSHAHSLKDLSVGLSILEKVVRYVDDNSTGAHSWSHGHHHHHHKSSKKLKEDDDDDVNGVMQSVSPKETEGKGLDEVSANSLNGDNLTEHESLRKRKTTLDGKDDMPHIDATDGSTNANKSSNKKETTQAPSNLVFGYLNLFSDGVHNFTDGMALGSAFLLYGSVGGWSRTLFLLAHELPQEIGDFGILVRSGFSVSKALFFNFLSALVALLGTALALLWGRDPGQSSLIEGFTAGGFIYIAVAGVLAEMNNGSSTFRSSMVQIISLVLGMAIALCISLVE
ncbi:IAA-alanine resistance protein 1 isoform X2 [Jatropha curcas]|uniref:IAA-alanine resistance protein 1 isoform X2 n=1 Tax=Jatropha curcas TaxID=180498 RepID=UPI0005FADF58|nr:IAA-alanine resistance protein 1 isoform X2 [Jatropha curcas]